MRCRDAIGCRILLIHRRQCNLSGHNVLSKFDVEFVNKDYSRKAELAAHEQPSGLGAPFRLVLPPPNVTGQLHLGHALTVTIEDAVVRHQRLHGRPSQWIPGYDHAGIATQSVVEKALWKEKGIRRVDIPRDAFIEECKLWAKKNSAVITEQLKRLGASLDWSQAYYTLDKKFSHAVNDTFCRLHEDGLISRGNRFVHWCTALQTTLSDQEVLRVEAGRIVIPAPNGGTRYYVGGTMFKICYGTSDDNWSVEVGTTRPETCFADVALAVHPDDPRHANLIGTLVFHPLQDRQIPVIADSAVSMDKGTGILKLTPEHDKLDSEIVSRNLDKILYMMEKRNIFRFCFDDSGRIISGMHPNFDGMDRFDAREKVNEILRNLNRGGTKMKHDSGQILICSRSGDVIEPRRMKQWNLDTRPLHLNALQAIKSGELSITPVGQIQRLVDWFSNKEPWCLSRQLLWGHQIPAFIKGTTDNSEWTIAPNKKIASSILGCDASDLFQETDVLDTWFSSALVPLVVSGWYSKTTSKNHYLNGPLLDLMETGHDIIGFWVARMIALTLHLTNGTIPFNRVFLHGLVRDSSGRKMSKSLGNVIDPLDVLDGISLKEMIKRLDKSNLSEQEKEIAKENLRKSYPDGIPRSGADALRFALLRHDLSAADIPLAMTQLVDEGLRFCNKLWNMTNYVLILKESSSRSSGAPREYTNLTDLWLLSRLQNTLNSVHDHMEKLAFSNAFVCLFDFLIGDLCDVYLETTKKDLWAKNMLRIDEVCAVLNQLLPKVFAQLGVFMPFASQAMYERIKNSTDPAFFKLQLQLDHNFLNPALESRMALTLSMVSTIRSLKSQLNLPKTMKFNGFLFNAGKNCSIEPLAETLNSLCELKLYQDTELGSEDLVTCHIQGYDVSLKVRIQEQYRKEFHDLLQKQYQQLQKRIEKQTELIKSIENTTNREETETKVKAEKRDRNVRRLENEIARREILKTESKRLYSIIESQKGLLT